MADSGEARYPARRAMAVANDQAILDAGVGLLAESGWGSLALLAVGREAGLSHRTVQLRYDDRAELAVAIWRERVGEVLAGGMHDGLTAAGLLREPADPEAFSHCLAAFATPSAELVAAGELLIVGQFDPVIGAAVDAAVQPLLSGWITPGGTVTRTLAAQRAIVIIQLLGLLAEHARPGVDDLDFTEPIDELLRSLESPGQPMTLPQVPAWHMRSSVAFDTGDPVQDAILSAVLELVAEHGYEGTKTSDVAKRAGIAEGTLFLRFPRKVNMLTSATELQMAHSLADNVAYRDAVVEEFGPGIGEAVAMRAAMRPAAAGLRRVGMEQYRLGWHNEQVRQAQRDGLAASLDEIRVTRLAQNPHWTQSDALRSIHWDLALGAGWAFLAMVAPNSWKLPYDAVTVPLYG